MTAHLSIGDFSRATHMTVKMLRHYHQIGLLEPADVIPHTGYRRYTAEQIPTAQVIRRFRGLDMPLEEIQAVLAAPDVPTRNEQITSHLSRLEATSAGAQRAVASLRDLLAPRVTRRPGRHRAAQCASRPRGRDHRGRRRGGLSALAPGRPRRAPGHSGRPEPARRRPAGGIFADDVFTSAPRAGDHLRALRRPHPADRPGRPPWCVPAVELAVITHAGPPADADRAYGTLAAYVARHALAVDGPSASTTLSASATPRTPPVAHRDRLAGLPDRRGRGRVYLTGVPPKGPRDRPDQAGAAGRRFRGNVPRNCAWRFRGNVAGHARALPAGQAIRGPGARRQSGMWRCAKFHGPFGEK